MAFPYDVHSILLLLLALLISLFFLRLLLGDNRPPSKNLPPGPAPWPLVGNLLHLRFSGDTFECFVKKLHQRYGPIITVWFGSRPLILIASHDLAYEALIEKGSVFADRPPCKGSRKFLTQYGINNAAYGPLWRSLRRNLVTQGLSPSAIKASGKGIEWGIEGLLENLRNEAIQNGGAVSVADKFRTALYRIMLYMCFGTKADEATLNNVMSVTREVLLSAGRGLDEEAPPIPGFLFPRRRARVAELRRRQRNFLLGLIQQRRDAPQHGGGAYVDSLLCLTVESGRKLHDDEIVTLCSEFLNGGTDTTSTSLQWTMANLVIRQDVQKRLYDEIVGVAGKGTPVGEDDLQYMPFLDAVVKETLRRHPPGHFVAPHAVTRPCELAGYHIPAEATINFYIAGMSMDPGAWKNPCEFRPERFADEGVEVDLTGTRDMKMIPFSAGRRVCPGIDLALLHTHLILARLVQEFSWECKPGKTVDLSETLEFTTVMKYPLQALIKERPDISPLAG